MISIGTFTFPETEEERKAWEGSKFTHTLGSKVLAAAKLLSSGMWTAKIDAVSGEDLDYETDVVLLKGEQLPENTAKFFFPQLTSVPYRQ